MNKNTLETYLVEIKKKYEIEKNGNHSTFLNNPTPASIRNLCVEILKSNTSKNDYHILKHFFELKGDENDKRIIERFDIDKLRPISNFYKGKTETPKHDLVDLMALLVDVEPRPLAKFLKVEHVEQENIPAIIGVVNATTSNQKEVLITKPKSNKKVGYILLSVVVLTIGFLGFSFWMNQKQCMQWQGDHYEKVDCEVNGLASFYKVEPVDEHQFNLKRVDVTDTTVCFRGKEPIVFYSRINGKLECFNQMGKHPETGQILKPISNHMLQKYVYKTKR